MPATVATVEVPIDLLIEAAGRLDALSTLEERLDVAGGDQSIEIVTRLCMCDLSFAALSDIEDDAEEEVLYHAHPVNKGIAEHSRRVVDAFEKTLVGKIVAGSY